VELQNLGFETGVAGAPGAAQHWSITINASVEEYAAYNGITYIEAWESFEFWSSGWQRGLGAATAAIYDDGLTPTPPTHEAFDRGWSATPWFTSLGATSAAQYGAGLTTYDGFETEWSNTGWQLGIGATTVASYDVGVPEAFEDFNEEWNISGWQLGIGATTAASFDGAAPESFEDFNEVITPVVASVDAATGTFTAVAHPLTNGMLVKFRTTGRAPGGLNASSDWWVVGTTANTFQVARESGGAAVVFDDQGAGVHSWVADPTRYWNDLLD
jgi:hypothetical protein